MRLREEKMEQQRLHQEDRVRRALERAQAEPKKKVNSQLCVLHLYCTMTNKTDALAKLFTVDVQHLLVQ